MSSECVNARKCLTATSILKCREKQKKHITTDELINEFKIFGGNDNSVPIDDRWVNCGTIIIIISHFRTIYHGCAIRSLCCIVIQSHYSVHMQAACNDPTTHVANFPRSMRQNGIHNLWFDSIECEISCSRQTMDDWERSKFGVRTLVSFSLPLLALPPSILKIIQSATFCSVKHAVKRLAHANRTWYRWRRFMREWRSLETQIDTSSRWGRRTEEMLSPGDVNFNNKRIRGHKMPTDLIGKRSVTNAEWQESKLKFVNLFTMHKG